MIRTTKAQRAALKAVFDRGALVVDPSPADGQTEMLVSPTKDQTSLTYKQFRAHVKPSFGCLMIPWQGMWLGIEPDGHIHS